MTNPTTGPGSYLRADSVAAAVLHHAATAPADAAITELVLRPGG